MYLDHVAFGTRDTSLGLQVLVGALGGTVIAGSTDVGFQSMQVFLGGDEGGMKVELLEPWEIHRTDFLERFLTKHGDGAHHLTFKVTDLEAELERVRAHGVTPVSVNLENPGWREAFLLPRDAHGTVVQLADSTMAKAKPIEEYRFAVEHGSFGEPKWWPEPPAPAADRARLRRVVVRTDDLDGARALFEGLLLGEVVAKGEDSLELEWSSGGRLLLEAAPDGRTGIDRLEVTTDADTDADARTPNPRAPLDLYGTPVVFTDS